MFATRDGRPITGSARLSAPGTDSPGRAGGPCPCWGVWLTLRLVALSSFAVVAIILTACCCAGGGGGNPAPVINANDKAGNDPAEVKKADDTRITLEKYNQVKAGMTYDQVFAILKVHGEELSRVSIPGTPETVLFAWKNWDGTNMNVTFQGGKVTTKAQFGLR